MIAIAKQINRQFVLPGKRHRIKNVELRGADRIVPLLRAKQRCLLLPNHSTHSDPHVMLEVQRRLRTTAATMAAYDVFLRGRLQAWFMQRIGCFSIDREGSDKQAMNCAINILTEGKTALTIFPEGNVLLMNARISPFLDGAGFVGIRAQQKLTDAAPVFVVPISLCFSYLTDCRGSLEAYIDELEQSVAATREPENSLRQRLRCVGLQILERNLRQRGFIPPSSDDADLAQVLEECALQIIGSLEKKIEIEHSDDSPLDRVRRIRASIHQIRIDDSQRVDHRVAATWADEAILAMRILSYSSDYLAECPNLDRHAETLEKLREDLAEHILPPIGDRQVIVQFGEPINLVEHLKTGKPREALASLTRQCEAAVQSGLDETRATLDTPGTMLLE